MFAKIYEIYEKEVSSIPFACRNGCASCCTQSVTMTTSEGKAILEYLAMEGRPLPDLPAPEKRGAPGITTNGLAVECMAGREVESGQESPWVYEPCVFLQDGCCTVYPARPFGCRSFGSVKPCDEHGTAEAPEWFITLNIVVNQLIEHLDQGGFWGNMYDILDCLVMAGKDPDKDCLIKGLLANRKVPGFLVPPGEEALIDRFLNELARADVLPRDLLV